LRYRIADFSEIARETFGFLRNFSEKGKTPEENFLGGFDFAVQAKRINRG